MYPYPITPPDLLPRMRIEYLMDADKCRLKDRVRITVQEIKEIGQMIHNMSKACTTTTQPPKTAHIAI